MVRGFESMTSDMKNLVVSFVSLVLMFLVIGIGIGNTLRIENDSFLFPLVIFLGIGCMYSAYQFMKTQ